MCLTPYAKLQWDWLVCHRVCWSVLFPLALELSAVNNRGFLAAERSCSLHTVYVKVKKARETKLKREEKKRWTSATYFASKRSVQRSAQTNFAFIFFTLTAHLTLEFRYNNSSNRNLTGERFGPWNRNQLNSPGNVEYWHAHFNQNQNIHSLSEWNWVFSFHKAFKIRISRLSVTFLFSVEHKIQISSRHSADKSSLINAK